MTAQFWLGLAVIPALAAVAYLAYIAKALIDTYWTKWRRPWWTIDDADMATRARLAADVAVARRTMHIPTPFGVAIVYRTKDDPLAAPVGALVGSEFARALRRVRVKAESINGTNDDLF